MICSSAVLYAACCSVGSSSWNTQVSSGLALPARADLCMPAVRPALSMDTHSAGIAGEELC